MLRATVRRVYLLFMRHLAGWLQNDACEVCPRVLTRETIFLPICFVAIAAAQTPLRLADAVREAQAAHPQLAAAADRIGAAEGLRRQAGLTYNPRLFLQSENARFWGSPALRYPTDTDNFAYLSQVFETGGKRARRTEFASASVDLAQAEAAVLRRQIAARVSLAFWNAAAASSLRNLLAESRQAYDGIVQYHRDRVREGAVAEVDLLRVLLEADRITAAVRAADAEYDQALIALQREMGRTRFEAIRLEADLTELPPLQLPDAGAILTARPELAAAREAISRARSNVLLQQANAKPDPEVLFGYKRNNGFDTLIGGVQLNLPVRNRNEGNIAAAQSEVRAAEHQARAVEAQVRADVESAWAAYQARRRLVEETLLPMQARADEIARIALAAYREGGMDLLRLIDAQRARLEAMTLYYRALAEFQQSAVNVLIATGAPL